MKASPRIASGERIYAIGDIHGRADLYAVLLRKIRADAERQPARRTRLILIGDIIDRGPASRTLVEHLMRHERDPNLIVLRGNHEEMMLHAMLGDELTLAAWLRFGGDATLRSWGLPENELRSDPDILAYSLLEYVPSAVRNWLRRRPYFYRSGDFYFVHAGIIPGVALDAQEPAHLLWVGREFLDSDATHPAVIVHGHSIVESGPEIRRNRIALDTGAYRTGRLSAVCLEGSRQWTLVATQGDDHPVQADRNTVS